MSGEVECRYYARDFTYEEMALLRELIAAAAPPTRFALSKEFCRRIGWVKPDGGLKDMMARVTMLAMHRDALIVLPAPRWRQNRPRPIAFGPDTEPPLFPTPTTLDEVRPLSLRPVAGYNREGKRWNAFIARYHYLGFTPLVGAQMRYAVHDCNASPLAMLGFSTAAWKTAPRDRFIGWTPRLREKNLPPRGRPLQIPHPALGQDPQPRLAPPVHRAPTTAPGLAPPLQRHPRADRNLRRDPALHRRRLSRRRMGPCRHHTGTRALRPEQAIRPAEKGHLAATTQKRLETNPQPLNYRSSRFDRMLTLIHKFSPLRSPRSFALGAVQLDMAGPTKRDDAVETVWVAASVQWWLVMGFEFSCATTPRTSP